MNLRALTAALLIATPLAASALAAQARPVLTPDDFGQWERLGRIELHPQGTWTATSISRVDRSLEVRLREVGGDERTFPHATRPAFSGDGRWMAFSQSVSQEEKEAADEPVHDRLGLVDLRSGHDTVLVPMRSYAFSDDGAWLAILGHAPSDSVGADLLVQRPGGADPLFVGSVDAFSWQDDANRLAITLKTAWGTANGVALIDPAAGTIRTLDSRDARYEGLTWDEDTDRLAVMRTRTVEGMKDETHDILVWDDTSEGPTLQLLSSAGRSELGDSLRITDFRGIRFHDDGRIIEFGVRPWTMDPEAAVADGDEDESDGSPDGESDSQRDEDDSDGDPDGDSENGDSEEADTDDEEADVQVWHWNDDDIIRAQEFGANRIARMTRAAVWHRDSNAVVVLGRDIQESVQVLEGGHWALEPDYSPYLFERRFGSSAADWYRVDVKDGGRDLLARGVQAAPEANPTGTSALLFEDSSWVAVDLATLRRTPLDPSGSLSALQPLADYDYPGPRPSWGVAAWQSDGSRAYLYDKYDVWSADLGTGSVERMTNGAPRGVRYRAVNLDLDAGFFDDPEVEADEALWLRTFDTRTKAAGYARLRDGHVDELLSEDAAVSGLVRAADADLYAIRVERWDDSPDWFVGNARLSDLTQVTETNPFQADFAWGRTELVDYTTEAGHDLQAILAYPADFVEGRRYPLILYQYERLSDGLHRYQIPDERDYYDFQAWSQAGYFVLMPDIVYEPGRPGPSALDAVESALDAAVATGHVDPDAMGLIGHSWGGYQAAYLPTRTHRFAASVAGAAITDFISFMGAVHWSGGLPESGHWETGQARMARPAWEDLEGHLESSPVNFIHELQTPVLLMHGDDDGVVDFRQGLEYYNYARRAGKPVVMLVYPGAGHGLSEKAQQIDYHRRIMQWFGHYLKGEAAPSWITDGETWVERVERIGGGR